MAQFALRYILMSDAVSTVITGAKNAAQAKGNADASDIAALSPETMVALRALYENRIAPHVHHAW